MILEWRIIDSEIARDILSKNTSNRKIQSKRVEAYARDMAEGRWEEGNPSPISIRKSDGVLRDGQHRLNAVILANVSINFLVAYVDDNVTNFDNNLPRTYADHRQMKAGNRMESHIASAVTISTKGSQMKKPSQNELDMAYEADADTWEYAGKISSKGVNHSLGKRGYFVLAIKNAIDSGCDTEQLEKFCISVNTGFVESPLENSAIVCRNHIMESKGKGGEAFCWMMLGIVEEYIYLYMNNIPRKKKVTSPTWHYTKIKEDQA